MLRRLRDKADDVVYAPAFRREIEEPIAGAIAVDRDMPLVITEGNYLLHWRGAHLLLDEVWFVETDEAHPPRTADRPAHGLRAHRAQAEGRAHGSDQLNAEIIAATRDDADLVVRT